MLCLLLWVLETTTFLNSALLPERGELVGNQMSKLWLCIYFSFWKCSLEGNRAPKIFCSCCLYHFFLSLPKKAAWVAMENASLKLKFMYPTLWTAHSHQIITGCWPCLATYSLSAPPHCLDYATTAKGFPGKSSHLPFNKLLSQVWYQRINHLEKCQKYKISNNHVVIDTRPRVLKRLQILWEYYFSVYMHLRRNCTHSNKK